MLRVALAAILAVGCSLAVAMPAWPAPAADPAVKPLPPIPLTLEEVLAWVDRTHPLLKGTGTEKIVARGRFLRALGSFEPRRSACSRPRHRRAGV